MATERLTRSPADKSLLRLFIGGSVDDGKSTLGGRLMYECGAVADDQLSALSRDSARYGTTGDALDFALLVDGLEDERQQGITIDVAYRYFASARRSFIVADTPGHESYTRNVATGASNSDVALIVVSARKGLLAQTRRHIAIARLVGVRHFVLALNKMDLVKWDSDSYQAIGEAFRSLATHLGAETVVSVPISARLGDNVTTPSANMPWYDGPTLLACLESLDVRADHAGVTLRLPVQSVLRPDADTRLYAGTIASGSLHRGDRVQIAISGATTTIERLLIAGTDAEAASLGEAVAVAFANHLDVGRGDIIVLPGQRPDITDQISAHLIWMSEQRLLPGRAYLLKIGTRTVSATVTNVKHRIAVDTLEHEAARTLELNEIGVCTIATVVPVAVDAAVNHPDGARFILIDRFSNETIAAGTIDFALRRGTNVALQALTVTKQVRAALKRQKPCILWFTGLSGAGKSTIANLVESKLAALHCHTYLLDGDNIRHGLNKDLGFTTGDRVENIRRVGEAAKLFIDAGMIVLCSFISPFRAERAAVRGLVETYEFIEIFVSAPLDVCEGRDPKGLYAKSRAGQLPNFTGIDSPYEPPEAAELVLDTTTEGAERLAQRVIDLLAARGNIEESY